MLIRFSLLTDGTSDRVLIHPIAWLLRQKAPDHPFQGDWADLSKLPKRPRLLSERIQTAIDLFPCEILFIHRDAEGQSVSQRCAEIRQAVADLESPLALPSVCVVPVRMTEAWLLFDERAIREASGNPNGRQPLELPRGCEVEDIPDPKSMLHGVLEQASELPSRRLCKFRAPRRVHRLAELIDDYSALMSLAAFRAMVVQVQDALRQVLRSSERTRSSDI